MIEFLIDTVKGSVVSSKSSDRAGWNSRKKNSLMMSGKRFSNFAFGIIYLFLFSLFLCSKIELPFLFFMFLLNLFSRHCVPMRDRAAGKEKHPFPSDKGEDEGNNRTNSKIQKKIIHSLQYLKLFLIMSSTLL